MKPHRRRPLAVTSWLIIITLLLVLWPKPSTAAQAVVRLADSNQNWSEGRFIRTGLAATEIGGVQLVPAKVLDQWDTATGLPYGLSQHTTTTYRNRIFVVGGNKLENGQLVKSDAFFASKLIPGSGGQLEPWSWQSGNSTIPALPIKVSDAATIVVEVGSKAYLFVLGGQRGEGNLDDVTTANIYSYEIRENPNGQLLPGSWQLSASQLPHEPNYDLNDPDVGRGGGARNISAATITIAGETYIYLFGGLSRTYIAGGYDELYFSTVFRSKVTASGSGPVLGAWEAVGDITERINTSVQTVALASAAAVTFIDPDDGSTGVYLIGGTNTVNIYDANAYIAKINGTDPAAPIAWLDTGNMSETRIGHDAVQAKGKITISGGSVNADAPTTSLARGFIEEDLKLYRPDPLSANFDLDQGALEQARMYHTMETLRDSQTAIDYAYILGGRVQINQQTQDRASSQVLYGDLDEQPQETEDFVADGRYYSKVFDFGLRAEYFRLIFTTMVDPGETIEMQYRVGNDRQNLSAPTVIPITPQAGTNTYTFTFSPSIEAQYFQFIATLKASPTNRRSSPILDKVELDVKRIGFPNIRFKAQNPPQFQPSTIDSTTTTITPVIPIINERYDAEHPALDADWDAPGSFFVDIYVIPPGQTPTAPTMGQTGIAWAEVSKALMKSTMEGPYIIPSANWRPGSCTTNCPTVNWKHIFTAVGTYNIYVMVDSIDDPAAIFGNVKESDTSTTLGETDNIFGPFTVTVNEFVDKRTFVPMTMTPPTQGAAIPTAPEMPRRRVHTIGDSQ
ncbi:MAG TPA: hypothetical protein VFZ66_02375 [Herpetosiphonaceae bacterium]